MNPRRSFFQEHMLTSRICICHNFLMRSIESIVSVALSLLRPMIITNESYGNMDTSGLAQAEATGLQPTIKGWRWFGALTHKGYDDRKKPRDSLQCNLLLVTTCGVIHCNLRAYSMNRCLFNHRLAYWSRLHTGRSLNPSHQINGQKRCEPIHIAIYLKTGRMQDLKNLS